MTKIEVIVTMTNDDGEHIIPASECSSDEFYRVRSTLRSYLGTNLLIYPHRMDDTFVIEEKLFEDEGCDISNDYVEIIESIYDNTETYDYREYLSFEIYNIE
jgi:hypothetical protein